MNFYRNFWNLQKFLQNPSLAFEGDNWKILSSGIDAVLLAFKQNPISKEEAALSRLHSDQPDADEQYFTKYLTSSRLLPLQVKSPSPLFAGHSTMVFFVSQMKDPWFRRHVLVQFLILFQSLRVISESSKDTSYTPEQVEYS